MTTVSSVQSSIARSRADNSVDVLAGWAQNVKDQWGSIFPRYVGHVPLGLAYVRCGHETRGNPNATSSQGEMGLLQLFPSTAAGCGLQGAAAYDPTMNVWCGMRDWNRRSLKIASDLAGYVTAPNRDFWGLSNLTMSIGTGGTIAMAKRAGGGFQSIMDWLEFNTADFVGWYVSWLDQPGKQSKDLVARRVAATGQWLQAASRFSSLTTAGYGMPDIPSSGHEPVSSGPLAGLLDNVGSSETLWLFALAGLVAWGAL